MSDNEIIKAFECYKNYPDDDITRSCEKTVLLKKAYYLMCSQQAEIERLKQEQVFAKAHYGELEWQHITLCEKLKTVKAATIKEFAEKLKANAPLISRNDYDYYLILDKCLDDIVKEMEGRQ